MKITKHDLIYLLILYVGERHKKENTPQSLCEDQNMTFHLLFIFNDILYMSFLAGTHVFKAFPAYTTTEI